MNQADSDIRDHVGRTGFHKPAIVLEALRRFASESSNLLGLLRILFPLRQVAGAQVVAVIIEQLFQTGPRHVRQLNFGFLGCCAGFAAFEEVLLAGTRN